MDHVVVDVEIQKTIEETPGGWDSTHLLGVAVACVWEYKTARMRVYGPDDVPALRERLLKADRVSGYNIWKFDLPVIWGLSGRGRVEEMRSKTDDLLVRIWSALGLNTNTFSGSHKGWGLDAVAGATLGVGKIGYGGDAPKWYQAGLIQKVVNYCLTPDHKLLCHDLRWVAAGNLKKGDTVLGFDEHGPRRRYRSAVIQSLTPDHATVYEVVLASGHVFRATKDHRWLAWHQSCANDVFRRPTWLTTDRLVTADQPRYSVLPRLLPVWDEDLSKAAGWLAGMMDGEGCLIRPARVSVAQNPGPTLDRLKREVGRYVSSASVVVQNRGNGCCVISVNGGPRSSMELLGRVRPERLIAKIDFNNLGWMQVRQNKPGILDRVLSVREIGVQEIVKISTSTGTFIADGYPMHNCADDVALERDLCDFIDRYQYVLNDKGVYRGPLDIPAWQPGSI